MATMSPDLHVERVRKLGVMRIAFTGGISAAIIYVLCWIGAQTPYGPGVHMYLQLYTGADLSTGKSLVEGALYSFGGWLIGGGIIAYIYNSLAALDRPQSDQGQPG